MRQPFFDQRGNRHSDQLPSNRSHHLPLRSLSPFLAWLLIALCYLEAISNSARADGTVWTCDQASLETALAGGGYVGFACSGVFVLTNTISITTDTVLDGSRVRVTISGNGQVRLFNVGSNVEFTVINLALVQGKDTGADGDSQNGSGGHGYGGAVYIDGGTFNAINCRFATNQTAGGTGASDTDVSGSAYGGAIYNRVGTLSVTNSSFIYNEAIGGEAFGTFARAGHGLGGTIYNERGVIRLAKVYFINNSARGGVNPNCSSGTGCGFPGSAWGGAIYSTNGTLELRDCTLSTNRTVPGSPVRNYVGGAAGGGALYAVGGTMSLVSTLLSFNQCAGATGDGFGTEADGGAIFNQGQLLITDCTFVANGVTGGSGRMGSTPGTKPGNGGAIYNLSSATILGSTFDGNTAVGGHGFASFNSIEETPGASGNGGAIYSTGTVAMVNCTLFQNVAAGGDGANLLGIPPTSGGPGNGGGIFVSIGSFAATNLTFAVNSAKGGIGGTWPGGHASDGSGFGGAIYVATGATATAVNTVLANSLSGSNCFGTLTDAGRNISSDGSCNFTTAGSLNNTDPKLGPFGNYGGPTATIPLLSGSPAIDAGDSAACPAVDQRGIFRPYGAGCDIGAFEFESAPLYTINGHIRGYLSPAGVVVDVGSNSVPVAASGFYTFTGLSPGTYQVAPVVAETRFVPRRRVVQVGPDSTDIDFNAYRLNALTVEASTNRDFQVFFAGEIEGTYRTQVSTNLIDWSLYSTNSTDTNGVFVVTNFHFGSANATFLRVVNP